MLITLALILRFILTIAGVIIMLPVYIIVMLINTIIEWFQLLFGHGSRTTEDSVMDNREG